MEDEFETLLRDVSENPEIINDTKRVSPEDVEALLKRMNPYAARAGPVPNPENKRVAVCSMTNLREDYLKRLTMTSLVGFLFQMHDEWEVPAERRRWLPPAMAKKNKDPGNAGELVAQLKQALAIAEQAAEAEDELRKERLMAEPDSQAGPASGKGERKEGKISVDNLEDEARFLLGGDFEEPPAPVSREKAAEARSLGLLYAATFEAHKIGLIASQHLFPLAKIAAKHESVKQVLAKCPPPTPFGQLEMPPAQAKDIIHNFLSTWFDFDPSIHVRGGHDAKAIAGALKEIRIAESKGQADPEGAPDQKVLADSPDQKVLADSLDPLHLPPATLKSTIVPAEAHAAAFKLAKESKETFRAVLAVLRSEDTANAVRQALESPEAFRCYLSQIPKTSPARPALDKNPPQDTFHRWNYYAEVNHDELRLISESLYPERPDLDWAVAIWDVLQGAPAEVDTAFGTYCKKHQDRCTSSLKAVELGYWTLLGDFGENRSNIQFYNKHTEILKRILDRHAADKGLGADLMRKRVKVKKAANIQSDGPDAKGLSAYKSSNAQGGKDLSRAGAERMSREEMLRLEKVGGNLKAAQELELLEQHESTIKLLTDAQKTRELTTAEKEALKYARDDIVRTRVMLEVPEDAIQVDVFANDARAGEFTHKHFYTEAEEPAHLDKTEAALPPEPSPK
jgi:hypothetical protein